MRRRGLVRISSYGVPITLVAAVIILVTWLAEPPFTTAFWPSFLATLVGLSGAFLVDRLSSSVQDRSERALRQQQYRQALTMLFAEVESNGREADDLARTTSTADQVTVVTDLSTSAWQAVAETVLSVGRADFALNSRLIAFADNVNIMRELLGRRLELLSRYEVRFGHGPTSRDIIAAELAGIISARASHIVSEASTLTQEIRRRIS